MHISQSVQFKLTRVGKKSDVLKKKKEKNIVSFNKKFDCLINQCTIKLHSFVLIVSAALILLLESVLFFYHQSSYPIDMVAKTLKA